MAERKMGVSVEDAGQRARFAASGIRRSIGSTGRASGDRRRSSVLIPNVRPRGLMSAAVANCSRASAHARSGVTFAPLKRHTWYGA